MVEFIDTRRERFGVEPICKLLQVAPSWYYEQKARQSGSAAVAFADSPRCRALYLDPAGVGGELPCLRSPQGLAAAEPGRDPRGALHGGEADGSAGH